VNPNETNSNAASIANLCNCKCLRAWRHDRCTYDVTDFTVYSFIAQVGNIMNFIIIKIDCSQKKMLQNYPH